MQKTTRMSLWLALLTVVLSFSAITFATAKILSHKSAIESANTAQNTSSARKPNRNGYIRRGLLSPKLAQNLSALGNRLEKPGKERLTVIGTWRIASTTREFAAMLEFPDKLRVVVGGPRNGVITFDGQTKSFAFTGC